MRPLFSFGLAIISIAGPEESPEYMERVRAACEAALGPKACELREGSLESPSAVVTFQDDSLRVVLRRTDGSTVERMLRFTPADSPEQRAVAAGLLVAALSAAQSAPEEPSSAGIVPPVPVPAAPLKPVPSPGTMPAQAVRSHGELTLAASLLSADVAASPWLGGFGKGAWFFLPSVGATLGLGAHHSLTNDPEALSFDASLGVVLRPSFLATRSFCVDFGLEGLFNAGEMTFSRSGESEMRRFQRGGGRLVAQLRFGSGFLSPWVGAELRALGPPLSVEVGNEPPLTVGVLGGALSVGGTFSSHGR